MEKIADLLRKFELVKKSICDKIESIPQNDKINEIKPNMFTLKFSDLDKGILSPEYYDFKFQCRIIIARLQSTPIHKFINAFDNMINSGYVIPTGVTTWRLPINPDVIEFLKEIKKEL